MKTSTSPVHFALVLVLFAIATGCKEKGEISPDAAYFMDPDSTSAIHAWWHWIDNAITREGITADLEAMKKQGISTATILNVSLFQERDLGIEPVIFNSPQWYEMFRWALEEAGRLGMTLGVHNCDGWSTSGGPWITPGQSMKICVWSKSYVKGGGQISLRVPRPHANMDFYRDIALLAYPAGQKENSFAASSPACMVNNRPAGQILYDGNPFSMVRVSGPTTIDISCPEPLTVSSLSVHPRKDFQWGYMDDISCRITLQQSDGSPPYRTIAEFEKPKINTTTLIPFPEITGSHFRVTISDYRDSEPYNPFGISELELLAEDELPQYYTRIPHHLEKTVTTQAGDISDMFTAIEDPGSPVDPSGVIDLTPQLTPEGILSWDAPAGDWTILRLGYTTTGVMNAPATVAGRGLECDKMDTAALNLHFSRFPRKLVTTADEFTGNTFEYIFVDSWECKYQNWTPGFPSEFSKRRGYSILPWLPVISGEVVGDPRATERFLHDFRKTIAELIEDHYYAHFSNLCHRLGVKSHAEVIYGGTGYPPLDVLGTNRLVDVPMFEFWAGLEPETGLIIYEPVQRAVADLPMHAAALYGKEIVPAEAYTGYANYSETPWDLKLFGDRAFCSGVNQMVLHSYVLQPDERKPGTTLGGFGQTFNRHNPWWPYASQWFGYHARIQYLLQMGVKQADILCFTGDRLYDPWTADWEQDLPEGFTIQKCNPDILQNHARVEHGRIMLDNGISYGLLLLPRDTGMELATLRAIAGLVEQGARVSGPRPSHTLSMEHAETGDRSLRSLADTLWGKTGPSGKSLNTYGKGMVYAGYSLDEVTGMEKLLPGFITEDREDIPLLFIHRKLGARDIWFVVNQEDREVTRHCLFLTTSGPPQIWDPMYGKVYNAGDSEVRGKRTAMTIKFRPKGSLIILFGMKRDPSLPDYEAPHGSWTLTDFTGTVTFDDLPGKGPVTFSAFRPFQDFEDPDIRYYSGEATWRVGFDLPDTIAGKERLFLSIDAADGYAVTLNGHRLGCAVFPDFYFPAGPAVLPGQNILEVRTGNCYRNRIIGERTRYGKLTDLWTTSPLYQLPSPGMPLKDAGIIGPVRLIWQE
jgi:hypothetical protein